MKFGSVQAWQLAPGLSEDEVWANEAERIQLAEAIGFDSVWIPEQHFFDYCGCPDALTVAAWVASTTSRIRVGTAVVNLTLTNPLRFAERASTLDRLYGGRMDLCIGRGYQWPQNVAFGVAEADTKPMMREALDIILGSWGDRPFAYDGQFYKFPPVRTYPTPVRPASEVLIHTLGGSTTTDEVVARGLPFAMATSFAPIEACAAEFRTFAEAVEDSPLDTDRILDRSAILIHALVAPTKGEARDIMRAPYSWQLARLGELVVQQPSSTWESIASSPEPSPVPDDQWEQMCEDNLFFEDPDGFSEKLAVLRDAGVLQVLVWTGVGGADHDNVMRSMRLLASEVMPRFRSSPSH